jgi:hypothetical protein
MDRGLILHTGRWTVVTTPMGQLWCMTNEFNFYLN